MIHIKSVYARVLKGIALTVTVAFPAVAVVVEGEAVEIQGDYLRFVMEDDGAVSAFGLAGFGTNLAGGEGLLQEGFGVANAYEPNRRLHALFETVDDAPGRPLARYSYDCDGPNIRGLHVTRTVEPVPGEASLRIRWRIEHRGDEPQWVAPWVRQELAMGEGRRIDVPTFEGVDAVDGTQYHAASRNWIAATDPALGTTVYGVFDANQTYAFLTLPDMAPDLCGFQTVFVPHLMEPGTIWETVYRINIVRGLRHIDFATDEIAAQLDYEPGLLTLLLASVKPLNRVRITGRAREEDGELWRLQDKRFDIAPGRLVRCAYEWEAPRDGVYDFLAQLQQDEKTLELGADTRPPHGGIDTAFVVGTPSERRMEAWTDAPYALERGGRVLKRRMAATGDASIWFESSLEKIAPTDAPEAVGAPHPSARIMLAQNECESFQVVIRPAEGEALPVVDIHVNDLVNVQTGSRIAASNIALYNVGYCDVRVPTHFENATGPWPDPLIPFEPFAATGGASTPVWLTVYAPKDAETGVYVGMLEILASGLEPIELWIEANVLDFALPNRPALRTDFGFYPEPALAQCENAGYTGSPGALFERYVLNGLRHRVTLRQLAQFPAPRPDYAAALDVFANRLETLRPRGATTFAVPPSLLDDAGQLAMADAFVVEKRLDGAFCPFYEAPPRPVWPRLMQEMQLWRERAPHIPTMVTSKGLDPFLDDSVDIWAVHSPVLDTVNNRQILERARDGGRVWWYVDATPSRPYANFFVDFTGIEHRILFWQTWALGIEGMHYWSVNYVPAGQDPWESLLDPTPANGNGLLLYPGPHGPVNSVRWEIIRDGIEDYDYLTILRERVKRLEAKGGHEVLIKRAENVMNLEPVFTSLVAFSRDPEALLSKRDAIGRMVVELGDALK